MRAPPAIAVLGLLLVGCDSAKVARLGGEAWPPIAAIAGALARAGLAARDDAHASADPVGVASPWGADPSLGVSFGARLPPLLADRADRLPGRATPVAPAPADEHTVLWGSRGEQYQSRIAIDAATQRAHVVTTDDRGRPLVSYDARTFVDDHGAVHVDARNAPIDGPMRGAWSPDSFAIDASGDVFTLDDAGQAERGSTGSRSDG